MSKKTKIIILSISLGIFILSAIFIPLTFLFFLKDKLETPYAPTTIITETRICATTNEITNAKVYVFKFTTPNLNTIKIISTTPSIYLDLNDNTYSSDFEYAGVYQVKCYVIGENEENKSEYSLTTEFEKYVTLDKPTVNLYPSDGERIINWESIENANLYEIYITSTSESTKIYEYTPPSNNNSNIESIFLTDIITSQNLPYGGYQISIIAKNSINEYYLDSDNSLPISFIYE